ncbi:MAG TPA: hypothetical protein PKC91_00870 [Ignavibacteria bacterium]|nr:hypothetical protein [Ignavibacteria bacterium]
MRNPFNFLKYLPHYLRKKFNGKYIIIESDDWGLERSMNSDSVKWMENKYGIDKMSRWSYDTLETPEDLSELYYILKKYSLKFESPPVITSNFITHNIDYSVKDKPEYIPLSNGFNTESKELKKLYREGIESKIIFPQLHGFSHYNLSSLEKYFYTDEGKESFDNGFFTAKSTVRGSFSFLQGELSIHNLESSKIKNAADEFNNYFGFYSGSVIPPTYIFDKKLIDVLKENKISMIQASNRLETSDDKRISVPYFQKRKGLYWSVRNARLDPHKDYNMLHEQCLISIEKAFEYNIPAVIDFHRVNFAGTYAAEYRSKTMKELDLLFEKIYLKWPEAKFLHSQNLNDILWQQETR